VDIDELGFIHYPDGLLLSDTRPIAQMIKQKEFDQAEELLLNAIPSPAVADKLRIIAKNRASLSRKGRDWAAVIFHLEKYLDYAQKNTQYCWKTVNQPPPDLGDQEKKWLNEARALLNKPTDHP
jgi:hypothetical protein